MGTWRHSLASLFLIGFFLYFSKARDYVYKVDHTNQLWVIHKAQDTAMQEHFIANQDTESTKIRLVASYAGIDLNVPDMDTDGCHFLPCPLVKGGNYTLDYRFVVGRMIPTVKTDVVFQLIGDHGLMVCLKYLIAAID